MGDLLAGMRAFWETDEGKAATAKSEAEEADLRDWLADHPEIVVTEHGGWAPEQWIGYVDGTGFYFRERHDLWRIETELAYKVEPSSNVSTWDKEAQDFTPGRHHSFSGKIIAEGAADCPGYGTTPLQRLRFIVQIVQTYYRQQSCDHPGMVNYCPICGLARGVSA